jgi:hypothetical protein
VLARLRELGFTWRLSYKEDNATLQLQYGRGAALYVSQADSLGFSQRRAIVEPPVCINCGNVVADALVLPGVDVRCSDCEDKLSPRKRR